LKDTWGYDHFRDILFYENPDLSNDKENISQGILIEDIVAQVELSKKSTKYSDILITAPTGAGKSVIFQIPAIYIANKFQYVTIVVSPLIALMYDQISSLKEK
jgi:superfamily II DNA helicase RecQ